MKSYKKAENMAPSTPQKAPKGKNKQKKFGIVKRFLSEILPCCIGAISAMLLVNLTIGAISGCGAEVDPATYLTGPGGLALNRFFFGSFGISAFAFPLIGANFTIFGRKYARKKLVIQKTVLAAMVQTVLGALSHILFINFGSLGNGLSATELFEKGKGMQGCGLISGSVGQFFWNKLNFAGSLMLLLCAGAIVFRFFFGLSTQEEEKKDNVVPDRILVRATGGKGSVPEKPIQTPPTTPATEDERSDLYDPFHKLPVYNGTTTDENTKSLDTSHTEESKAADEFYQPAEDFSSHTTVTQKTPGTTKTEGAAPAEKNTPAPFFIMPSDPPQPAQTTSAAGKTTTAPAGKPTRAADSPDAHSTLNPIDPLDTGYAEEENGPAHAAENAVSRIKNVTGSGKTIVPANPALSQPEPYPDTTASQESISPVDESEFLQAEEEYTPVPAVSPLAGKTAAQKPQAPLDLVYNKPAQSAPAVATSGNQPPPAPSVFRPEEKHIGEIPTKPEKEPRDYSNYRKPPVSLLQRPTPSADESVQETEANCAIIAKTLENFHVHVNDITYHTGPSITRYEVRPAPGVRVSAITGLEDNLALELATKNLRIEAPIPGCSAIGFEVPKKHRETVALRQLLEREEFLNSPKLLNTCLGLDVVGNPIYCNLEAMPHLLIAGATGSGKSVCLNSIILSLLYHTTPADVRIMMIDPKQVEFFVYRDIPNLFVPVVSDPKEAACALSCATKEMDDRFSKIQECQVRNIGDYNKIADNDPDLPHMTHLVIVIDELADLMTLAKDIVEKAIVRLAQLGRASGIHLVIGTQRPSVDVITGLLKANIPSRIAFTVSSNIDARTIMDTGGAEKLTGKGDMLYAPIGLNQRLRVQGAFVTDSEVSAVVNFLKKTNGKPDYNEAFMETMKKEKLSSEKDSRETGDGDGGDLCLDSLFVQAGNLAITSGKISTSLLQRRFSIGYGRAAKILDSLEVYGIISSPDGNKPREALITIDEFNKKIEDGVFPLNHNKKIEDGVFP